jgi:SAM-dependent methyltransferase
MMERLSPGLALDAGCGRGLVSFMLLSKGWQVDAFDISIQSINFVKRSIPPSYATRIRLHVLNLDEINRSQQAIDLNHGEYDLVVCSEILEHLENDREALGQLTKFLKRGGNALITAPLDDSLMDIEDEFGGHYRRYSLENLMNIIRDAGLVPMQIVRWGFPVCRVFKRFIVPIAVPVIVRRGQTEKSRSIAGDRIWTKAAKLCSNFLADIDSKFYGHAKSIGVVILAEKHDEVG